MSSRRTKPQPLSDTEIRQIAADLAAGRPPMVWFTSEAVGVPEGRSGKVLALGDPAEGDFLQVRPTGSKDVLSFSPTEVTLTKPARRTAPAAKPRKDTPVSMPSSSVTPSSLPPSPAPEGATSSRPAPAQPAPAAAKPPAAKPAAESDASTENAKPAAAKQTARPAKATPARKTKTPEVTVTLSGTAEGEWTVDVVNGKKRTVRGLTVAGSSVAQAAKILHPEVAEVVDSVLESVRNSQRAKVEQLQSELEQARRVLDELSG